MGCEHHDLPPAHSHPPVHQLHHEVPPEGNSNIPELTQEMVAEERASIRWDINTMWQSREWEHFERSKLEQLDSIVHCECGEVEGCDKCYGEPYCGCHICYRPPKKHKTDKTKKIKKKNMKQNKIEDVIFHYETYSKIPSLTYHSCNITICNSEKSVAKVIETKAKFCHSTREVSGPKKTRFYCMICQLYICHECVSSRCVSHTIQFAGSTHKFICKYCP